VAGPLSFSLLAFCYYYHPSAPISSLLEPAPFNTRFLSTLVPNSRVFAALVKFPPCRTGFSYSRMSLPI